MKTLEIRLKPGWKAGTKITFEREGDETPQQEPGDIAFIIREKPHPDFSRDGSDLRKPVRLVSCRFRYSCVNYVLSEVL